MKPLIALIRGRNEELIAQDTFDHLKEFCEKIYFYDDASTDKTLEIAKNHPYVVEIIENKIWNPNQTVVQGQQRSELFEYAKFRNPDANFIYCDFDERIDFDFKSWNGESAVVMKLFDARMTTDDQSSFGNIGIPLPLKDFRKYFDPYFREIPFIFNDKAKYIGVSCERYPQLDPAQPVIHAGLCQHFGKALSKQHWQDTCAYYSKYLPVYAEKWEKRKKESGVISSDGLLTWDEIKSKYA